MKFSQKETMGTYIQLCITAYVFVTTHHEDISSLVCKLPEPMLTQFTDVYVLHW